MAQKLISLKKAAENTGYHPDYLGYLIRNNKLEGQRIGRNWFTTEKAIKSLVVAKKFLPLREFLFSWVKPKIILIFLLIVISVGILFVFFSNPLTSYQYLSGDFIERTKSAPSQLTEEKTIKEVKITNYISDDFEETEVAAQIELESLEPEKKLSFFQEIIIFFKGEKK